MSLYDFFLDQRDSLIQKQGRLFDLFTRAQLLDFGVLDIGLLEVSHFLLDLLIVVHTYLSHEVFYLLFVSQGIGSYFYWLVVEPLDCIAYLVSRVDYFKVFH